MVLKYLMGRGIHPVVLDFCLEHKLLFETKQYHNALFAGYDQEGKVRYAALRGTMGNFKGEVTGSDKHYSFSISAAQESGPGSSIASTWWLKTICNEDPMPSSGVSEDNNSVLICMK